MSKEEIRLCTFLLNEFFGEIVANIGTCLLKGPNPLELIVRDTVGVSINEARKALCILVQQNLAKFEVHEKGFVEFRARKENMLLLIRYPRYIYCTKTLYGDTAELLTEELLLSGQITMSDAIQKVVTRLQGAAGQAKAISVESVWDKFVKLAETHFVMRCPRLIPPEDGTESDVPEFDISENHLYDIPKIRLDLIAKKQDGPDEPPSKTIDVDNAQLQPDRAVYWRVNFERFHQYFRDQEIISAVTKRVDEKAGEIVRRILRLSETKTNPLSPQTGDVARFEILDVVQKEMGITDKLLDSYLSVLTSDDANIVSKSDERGGGMYVINVQNTLKLLAEATVTSFVEERFGSKCSRIFRLLMMEKYLEQQQIEKMAMIPAKDAREMTYKMLQENIISIKEIAQTPDHAPSRTFYLYHVTLNPLCRTLLDWSYKSVANAMSRRSSETKEHKRLLDKEQRVDAIIASHQGEMDPTHIQEVEDIISPPERAQLEKVKHAINKLHHCELEIDNTIFTLNSWINTRT